MGQRSVVVLYALLALLTSVHGIQLQWERLNQRHIEAFFKPEVRLSSPTPQNVHRRLADCSAFLDKFHDDLKAASDKFKTVTDRIDDLKTKITSGDAVDLILDAGESVKSTRFDKFLAGANGLMVAGMTVYEAVSVINTQREVGEMTKQAQEVFTVLNEIKTRVQNIPALITTQLDLSSFEAMVADCEGSANAVIMAASLELLQQQCVTFNPAKISTAVTYLDNYPTICVPSSDVKTADRASEMRRCLVSRGITIGGLLVRLLTAESLCVSASLVDANGAQRLSLDVAKALQLFSAVAKTIRAIDGGSSSSSGSMSDAAFDKRVDEFDADIKNVTSGVAEDGSLVDAAVSGFVQSLNDWKFTSGDINENIANFTAGSAYQMLTKSNPAAGQMATVVALAVGAAHNAKMDKLNGIQTSILDQHDERVGLINTIDTKIWSNHNETMTKVQDLGNLFTSQHDQRMGQLTAIQGKVNTIQTNVNSNFQKLNSDIVNMGQQWTAQIGGIENEVVKQGAETTSFLSNSISAATEQIGNQIQVVSQQVTDGHERVMAAIDTTVETTRNEYDKTRDTLWQSSSALEQVINQGMYSVGSAVTTSFDDMTEAVTRRMTDMHTTISNVLTGVSNQLAYEDNKLIVMNSQVQNISAQLGVVKLYLDDINTSFDFIAKALADLPSSIRAEIFKNQFSAIEEEYTTIRDDYQKFTTRDLDPDIFIDDCQNHHVYDLFLTFLGLVDISDHDVPTQMDKFQYDLQTYEQFGLKVLGILRELSFLDSVCAKLEYGPTMRDLEEKVQDQADQILAASAQLARHVDEVIPAYLINIFATKELAAYAAMSWATQGPKMVEELRSKLQTAIGDFTHVSVVRATDDATLNVKHLDLNHDAADMSSLLHRGIQVSSDQKLAVLWGTTRVLPGSPALNSSELLQQGIYRGSVSSTSGKCYSATATGYYPVCDAQCNCEHYEDFASETSPTAGRAMTYFSSNDYDSDFVIESVFDAGVQYVLESVSFSIGNLGRSATGALSVSKLMSKDNKGHKTSIWEGFTDTGYFLVYAANVKGLVLVTNALEVEIAADSVSLHKMLQLFCDGQRQNLTDTASSLTILYTCSEKPLNLRSEVAYSSPNSTVAYASSGLPTKRLERAVCAESDGTKVCKVTGTLMTLNSTATTSLVVGEQVEDVTVYAMTNLRGNFIVCRKCQTSDLDGLGNMGSFMVGVPDVPANVLQVECAQPPDKLNILICRLH